eukprot:354012-Chlamydomonas_euryale.AAC.1
MSSQLVHRVQDASRIRHGDRRVLVGDMLADVPHGVRRQHLEMLAQLHHRQGKWNMFCAAAVRQCLYARCVCVRSRIYILKKIGPYFLTLSVPPQILPTPSEYIAHSRTRVALEVRSARADIRRDAAASPPTPPGP